MEFNESQAAAVFHQKGPMMVLAGPGSGKTTVITHRIARLIETGVSPSSILVITFTKAAAREMKERFQSLCAGSGVAKSSSGSVSFGTFHSVFYYILRLAYRFPPGNVVSEEEKRSFLKTFLRETAFETEDEGEFISSIINEISYVKGSRIDLNYYYSQNCPEEWFKTIYTGYDRMLSETGKLDFDDMLVMCHELFSQRRDILSAWQRKYRYILIDEFQDINQLQYEIVKMLAAPEYNLFIVGDDDQSIYRFRGARPEIMLGFEKDFPGAKKTLLSCNYRSTREIVESSLKLIGHNRVRYEKQLVPVRGQGRPADVRVFENLRKEARGIASLVRQYYQAGIPYEDIAVLFRTGMESGLMAETLMEYNVPFKMRDAVLNLYSHWIARDIFAYLTLAEGSRKRSDIFRIMNRPNRYLSRDAFEMPEVSFEDVKRFYQDKDWMEERIERLACDLKILGRLKPSAAVNYIRKTVGYDEYLRTVAEFRRIRAEELFEILDRLSERAADFATFGEWREYAERYAMEIRRQEIARQDGSKRGGENADVRSGEESLYGDASGGVTLSTMHSAKGLEFAVVFILNANEGITPHHKAGIAADMEEERRLFYVAVTRAKDRLHLCAVRERFHRKQELSRFVREMMEETTQGTGQAERKEGRGRSFAKTERTDRLVAGRTAAEKTTAGKGGP